MKKRWNYKIVSLILAIFLVFSLSANVMGANGLIEIQAYLNNGIKVVVKGELFESVDPADGSKYIPVTYKGRTYLPLRAIAEAVGLEVTWDGPNNTAIIGDVGGEIAKDTISYVRVTPEFAPGKEDEFRLKSRQPEYLNRAPGRTFEFGYAINPDHGAGVSIDINTNFEYDKFKATFWIDDNQLYDDGSYINSPEITFLDENGSPVKTITDLEWGNLYEIELDIKDVKQLQVWIRGGLSIIGEPMLGK